MSGLSPDIARPLKGPLRGPMRAMGRFLRLSCPPVRSLLALASVAALGAACAAGASTAAGRSRAASRRGRSRAGSSSRSSSRARRASRAGSTSSSRAAGSSCSRTASAAATPLLDISGLVTAGGEQGLLGLAFHPSYPKVRKLYVQYTARDGSTKLVEYRTNGNSAPARRGCSSRARPVRQPQRRHARLRPERPALLHDGRRRRGRRSSRTARRTCARSSASCSRSTSPRRALKIEALGLRNAWRFSFDRANGDLYIGDVGQGAIEEIDYQPAASPGLENYGWDVYEGRSTVRGQGRSAPASS